MHYFVKKWRESFCFYLFFHLWPLLLHRFIVLLRTGFWGTCWTWFDTRIRQSRPVQFFLNPRHLADAWYASLFYQKSSHQLQHLGWHTPTATLPWNTGYLGAALLFALLLPARISSTAYLFFSFLLLSLFYFSHHCTCRQGTVFALAQIILGLFWGLSALAAPPQAAESLGHLLLGIGWFFLVSFSVRTEKDLTCIIHFFYLLLCVLCALGFLQRVLLGSTASATFAHGVAFGEIIVLLFPLAFIYPITCSFGPRRILYLALLLTLLFLTVPATGSRAAFIGFYTEFFLLILFLNRRYLWFFLILIPAVSMTALKGLAALWAQPRVYGNFFENLYHAFQNIWNHGFGVNRAAFLDLYRSAADIAAVAHNTAPAISPVYFTFLMDAGALLLLGFLTYLLRLAHSTLLSLFQTKTEYKPYFAAGISTLIGISVSSLLESALLSPRTLLLYWWVLGLVRTMGLIHARHHA